MELKELTKGVLGAFEELNIDRLNKLDELYYSHSTKQEFITELQKLFDGLMKQGVNSLIAKPSKCKYCYPTAKAYSFHHPETDEFIIRYVIHQETEDEFRIEECRNRPLREGSMPF
ncbi:hypothetical protein [Aestuariivivens insulae]|uniref:hypothetical protein n=1 Tax=Aestuariivivens insulae TaxID=1621988 RepID=UPI001F5A3713|nr:hypothetical protein [Aestuariivivens insulae]